MRNVEILRRALWLSLLDWSPGCIVRKRLLRLSCRLTKDLALVIQCDIVLEILTIREAVRPKLPADLNDCTTTVCLNQKLSCRRETARASRH